MVKYLTLIVIFIISYLSTLQPIESISNKKENDQSINTIEQQIIDFLNNLATYDSQVFTKKVFFDFKKISLNDYFKISNPGLLVKLFSVTSENINEITHLLNTVVSCELCNITYFFVKLIDVRFESCRNVSNNIDVSNKNVTTKQLCYIKHQSKLLTPVLKTISSMILTLAGLLKQTKNFVSKNHEVMKILVSWTAYINHNLQSVPNKKNKNLIDKQLDTVIMTNGQVKLYLERYNINSCQSLQEYKKFTENTDNYINENINSSSNNEIDEVYNSKIVEKAVYLNHNFKSNFDVFVFSTTNNNAKELLKLMNNEIVDGNLKIQWNGGSKSMSQIYDSDIQNTPFISLLLKYERITLKVITNIIISYVQKILDKMLKNVDSSVIKSNDCKYYIVKKIDLYIEIFRESDQPLYLINNLVAINKYVWLVCSYMKNPEINKWKIEQIMSSFRKISSKIFQNSDNIHNFSTFLYSLSNILICMKIHPVVTNVYLNKIPFHGFDIFWYTVDYKLIVTKYLELDKNNSMCAKIDTMLQKLEYFISLKECESVLKNSTCFTEFSTRILFVRNAVLRIIINDCQSEEERLEWKKIFLTIEYNTSNVTLLKAWNYKFWMNERIQIFKTFTLIIRNLLDFRYQIYCNHKLSDKRRTSSTSSNSASEKNVGIIDWKNHPKMKDALKFLNFFETYHMIARCLYSVTTMSREHRLYWDGSLKTIYDVSALMNRLTVDLSQDASDFQGFFVKWVFSIGYLGLLDILNDSIVFKHKPVARDIQVLKSSIERLLNEPLFTLLPIKNNIFICLMALESFDGIDLADLKYCQKNLIDELEFVGADPRLRPNIKDSISNRVKYYSTQLNKIFQLYSSYSIPVKLENSDFVGQNDLIPATIKILNIIPG